VTRTGAGGARSRATVLVALAINLLIAPSASTGRCDRLRSEPGVAEVYLTQVTAVEARSREREEP
jgi:hypothetical protein